MAEVIFCDFAGTKKITRREYLLSAERNVRAAIDSPDLSRPLLRMAMRRLETAIEVQKQGGGGF